MSIMNNIFDWYWNFASKRNKQNNSTSVSIGDWLDPIARIMERNATIHENINKKACLALWGPSQSGKSTMMSYFVDGNEDDGSDSALTWSDKHKVRFSPINDVVTRRNPDTLIFNPWNKNSDASGLATRYTLSCKEDSSVDVEFPIELKLTSRVQIMHAIALGYLAECDCGDCEVKQFRKDDLINEIPEDETIEDNFQVDQESYYLLKELADTVEYMRGTGRFCNLFNKDSWDMLRKKIVSAPVLLSNKKKAMDFITSVLWDSNEKLTSYFKDMEELLTKLNAEWMGSKVYCTSEVGALLLDIDSYKCYANPEGEKAEIIKEKIKRLSYFRKNGNVYISTNDDGTGLGNKFGPFQAICAEIVVPLKREALEAFPQKRDFLNLAEKCDFLDFPGLSNKNKGDIHDRANSNLIQLDDNLTDTDFFIRIFKAGKTESFVYNYAKKYGIDAFCILSKIDRSISRSVTINSVVSEWIRAFVPNWKPGERTDLPIFINMTFFASLLNGVLMNGLGNGLSPYADRLKELIFLTQDSNMFFPTTYQRFPDGKISDVSKKAEVVAEVLKDSDFVKFVGMDRVKLETLYDEDGGLNNMFASIACQINKNRRLGLIKDVLIRDRQKLDTLFRSQLPFEEGADDGKEALRSEFKECIDRIKAKLVEWEKCDDEYIGFEGCRKLSNGLKTLFSTEGVEFTSVPKTKQSNNRTAIDYVEAQVEKWYSSKINRLRDDAEDELLYKDKELILKTLKNSIDKKMMVAFFKSYIDDFSTKRDRLFGASVFAKMLGNMLKYGVVNKIDGRLGDGCIDLLNDFVDASKNDKFSKNSSPYYVQIIEPTLKRLDDLSETIVPMKREACPGDEELKDLFDKIKKDACLFEIGGSLL